MLFESDQLERTEEFLSEHYAPMRIGSATATSRARIRRAASDAVFIDRVEFGFEMNYDVEPLGRIGLCDMRTGSADRHGPVGSRREDFGPGEMFVLAPPDRAYGGTINHARYSVTMMDVGLLEQVASPARGQDGVRLLGHRPVGDAEVRSLRAAIDHVDRDVLGDPVASSSPLLVAAAHRYLAAHVLNAFPNNSAVGGAATDSRDAHPATVRRAVAFIEASAGHDISLADIAAAAYVSVRALQLAFRRHLDTTPTAYLRRVRLDGARRDLLAAQPGDGATVAAISGRWGFANQGRFAQAYRRSYDESPGQTLRR